MHRMTRRAGTLAVALVLATAGTAHATAPPKGNYGCTYTTFSGTFFSGTLNILSKSKYSVNKKKKGRYSTRGKSIKFKTGDYKGLWKGKWSKASTGRYQIKLTSIKDPKGTPTMECTRDGK